MDAWHALNDATIGTPAYWRISLQNRAVYDHLAPFIEEYAHGDVLDYGAGKLAWRDELRRKGSSYFSLDVYDAHPELDLLHPGGAPYPLSANSYDTIFCSSVLEHSPDPLLLLKDMRRFLRDPGTVILSAPFVYYLHGEPYDYWRFSKYGLEELAERSGFTVVKMEAYGSGLYHILNLPSIASSCLLWRLGLKKIIPAVASFWYFIYRLLSGRAKEGAWSAIYTAVLKKNDSIKKI